MAEIEAGEVAGGPAVADVLDAPEADTPAIAPAADEAPGTEAAADTDSGEVDIRIEGESPSPDEEANKAPEWVRTLRKENAEKARATEKSAG